MNANQNRKPLNYALILAAFSALGPFTIDMYLSGFPEMQKSFDTSASVIQISLTACILGLAAGQIIMGALSDVHGRRKPLFISMIIYCLVSFGCALFPNISVLIALRFVQGFAASAGLVISRAIVRDSYSGVEMTKFFSLLMMIGNVGPLIAPVAGSAIMSFTSWHSVFSFLGIFGLFLTVLTLMNIKETLPIEKRVTGNFKELLGNFKSLITNRTFMGYALAPGIMFSGVFAYVSGTPFIYQKLYGVSPEVFSILFAMNGISLIIGSQVANRLTGRISERRILSIGLFVAFVTSTAILISVLTHGSLYTLVVPLFFFIAANGIISPIFSALALETQGHIAGSASALIGVIPFVLGAITSPLVGAAGEYSAMPLGIIIFTTNLLSIIVYLGMVTLNDKRLFVKSIKNNEA